jgi:hypothetical protein
MKNFPLIILFFTSIILLNACSKEISAPEQKAKGCNVVYIKVNDTEEFLLDGRSKLLHKKTASNLDENNQMRYAEVYGNNNKLVSDFDISFIRKDKKADFEYGRIKLQFDPETQVLDTSFLRKSITKDHNSFINFSVIGDNPRVFYVDSILDYKIIKWDKEDKIFTFEANATYAFYPSGTPPNPKIYFYVDIKY